MTEPDTIVDLGSVTLTEENFDAFKAAWRKAYRARDVRLLTPLPRRVRLRLWRDRQLNAIGSWLCGHRAGWAAVAFWRAFGRWS